ncbi:transketolase [Sulfidibacter corallicola]|uniref:Transketolase n=1 Tax=Sulfidibacter corallicola TaxID=2818388 RepID=A0A8A4TPU6_SULCO|nr:transketolase [Sulfidibacter corallicola]QTD51996.1 transketolase [Sulfidibacter corallicola]
MTTDRQNLDTLCINTIRTLAIDAIQKANSGHPGLPMGAAPMAYTLWQKHLHHNPADPKWSNRDRFVLSAGHGSMLLYALLHLTGYDLTLDDIKQFRQWHSKTPGHPESFMTPGVEATTGPLGQGTANAVGMAIAERALAHHFNRPDFELVNHFTYALVGDGDLMEGISAEAASLAGHLQLGKLIYLYDANDICLDGPTANTFTENVAQRYKSYGWHVQTVQDGDTDLEGLDVAISNAKTIAEQPSLIIVKTTIGYGSPNKSGKSAAHGAPLGDGEIELTKKALGWTETEPFSVPEAASTHFREALTKGGEAQAAWTEMFERYGKTFPELAEQWRMAHTGDLPEGWDADLPTGNAGDKVATRSSSGTVLNAVAAEIPWLLGGDADLSCSTKTGIKGAELFDGRTGAGRNIQFGVREHAMGAIANGMAYHGGIRPYTATFFCFSDYMRPAIRLAALCHLNPIFIFTHDSVALGEDGPTHQPVEHLASLRAIPNNVVIRPADATEVAEAWRVIMGHEGSPINLVLSRQNLPTLDRSTLESASGVAKGAYTLSEAKDGKPAVILIGTGAEVHTALAAKTLLEEEGIAARVVSMPSWELFAAQGQDYRDAVLPPDVDVRVAIEAGCSFGWEKWIGRKGAVVGVDQFGASAPAGRILTEYGLTAENLANTAKSLLD